MSVDAERSLLSPADRRRPIVRSSFAVVTVIVFAGLVVTGIGPLIWLVKASVSTTQQILTDPLALLPAAGVQLQNFVDAWGKARVGTGIGNSLILAVGCIVASLVVCVSLAYVLSVLRPRWAPVLGALVLATLFIPGVVILVPLYLTVLELPVTGTSLLNTYWAVWLPAAASPFNVLVVKRFFDAVPRELFDAAKVDGAGPWRVLFSILLPLSRPILVVIAIFSGFAAWKDFLWPKLVLPAAGMQPISVSLVDMARNTDLAVQMAALLLALALPLLLFVIFQKQFLAGVALSGGVKE